jgi:site-specific DNA-methyltransferase (adenine-specific)
LASRVINKEIEQVAIDLLKHHPRNANNGDVEAIKKSLAVNGWYGSVVANLSTKHILAGNHRVMAAKALGWETVPVQWVDVTPEEELRILVVDNRTTRIGQDDTTKITDILAELANTPIGLEGTGYGAADLDALIDELAGTADPAELLTDPDEVPEEVETRCKPGDLWILGRHRLLCGDSTKADDVARLMDGALADLYLTDPPYNVALGMNETLEQAKARNRRVDGKQVANDSMDDQSFRQFLKDVFCNAFNAMNLGANYYIWHGPTEAYNFAGAVKDNKQIVRQCLVWSKDSMVMGRQDYQWKHEECLYGWKDGAAHNWFSDYKQTTILEFNRPSRSEEHPTMKPVELFEYQIGNSCPPNGLVLDTFLGSGTSIIASEKLGMKCYGLELDPHYCDVIIQRWENATGQKAVLDGR